jgi:uncharacterized damage-inducible protein DinB
MNAIHPGTHRPEAGEYAPFYGRYIGQVPDGPVAATLEAQGREAAALLAGLDEERALHRYAPGKWSVKEVVGHVIDVERVFALRALAFSRAERQPLFGMEQDEWVAAAGFDRQPIADLADELASVRRATLTLTRGLDDDQWMRRGTASGCEFTVRATLWIIAGHERHHLQVLREKYL